MAFRLTPRELRLLKFDEVPEIHRDNLKKAVEGNANDLLEGVVKAEKELIELRRLEKAQERALKNWDKAWSREGKTLEEKRRLLEKYSKDSGRKDRVDALFDHRLFHPTAGLKARRLNAESTFDSEKRKFKEFSESRSILLKTALMRTMNNFHNHFPGYYVPSRYPEIESLVSREAEKMGFNIRNWLAENKIFYGKAHQKHFLRLWPLFVKMLAHVEDSHELTG